MSTLQQAVKVACSANYQAQGHMLPIGLRLTLNRRKSRDPQTQNSQKAPLNHETLKPPTLKTQSPKPHNPRSIRRAKEKPSKTDLLAAHQRATQQGPEKVNYSAEPAEKKQHPNGGDVMIRIRCWGASCPVTMRGAMLHCKGGRYSQDVFKTNRNPKILHR